MTSPGEGLLPRDELIAPIAGYWHAIPTVVREHLGDEDDVMRMVL